MHGRKDKIVENNRFSCLKHRLRLSNTRRVQLCATLLNENGSRRYFRSFSKNSNLFNDQIRSSNELCIINISAALTTKLRNMMHVNLFTSMRFHYYDHREHRPLLALNELTLTLMCYAGKSYLYIIIAKEFFDTLYKR